MSAWEDKWAKEKYYAGQGKPLEQYIFNIGIMLSQVPNCILGGDCDESVSSRLGRWVLDPEAHPFWKWVAGIADKIFGKDHCVNAVERNINRAKEIWHWSCETDYPVPPERQPHFQ